jgi:hypothetical protein
MNCRRQQEAKSIPCFHFVVCVSLLVGAFCECKKVFVSVVVGPFGDISPSIGPSVSVPLVQFARKEEV